VTERWCEIVTDSLSEQLREVVARPGTDILAALREFRLLPAADEQETRVLAAEDLAFDRDLQSARAHLDPQRPHQIVDSTTAALFAGGCIVHTWASPPFLRFPSVPEFGQSLVLYFEGLAPAARYTAVVDLQVVSTGGSVSSFATGSPERLLVTHEDIGGARVSVPVAFTTIEGGSAVVVLQPVDETELKWLGADIFEGS
jgi:hypothetical protein